jgi:zinc protease
VRSFGIALATGQTVEDVEAWPERIEAVTAEQVNAAAAYVFAPERSATGLLSPAPLPAEAAALEPATGPGVPAPAIGEQEINAGEQDDDG